MKILVILLVLIVPIAAQQKKKTSPQSKAATAPAKAAKKKEPPPPPPPPYNGPPAGAEKISTTDWRWIDKDGKAWIYRRGPITWVREPDENAAPGRATGAAATMTAVDKGDSVEFTRPTPVAGVARWTKKKAELDADEKAAWEAAQQPQEKK